MKNMKKSISMILLSAALAISPTIAATQSQWVLTAEAHSGRTDSNGGHKDNKNASGLGSYHYHCGGYLAHLHTNGVCPYKSGATTVTNGTSSTQSISADLIKQVQEVLNSLGYECGEADGIFGENSKAALMKYQEDNGLAVDGVIGNQVKEALGIIE